MLGAAIEEVAELRGKLNAQAQQLAYLEHNGLVMESERQQLLADNSGLAFQLAHVRSCLSDWIMAASQQESKRRSEYQKLMQALDRRDDDCRSDASTVNEMATQASPAYGDACVGTATVVMVDTCTDFDALRTATVGLQTDDFRGAATCEACTVTDYPRGVDESTQVSPSVVAAEVQTSVADVLTPHPDQFGLKMQFFGPEVNAAAPWSWNKLLSLVATLPRTFYAATPISLLGSRARGSVITSDGHAMSALSYSDEFAYMLSQVGFESATGVTDSFHGKMLHSRFAQDLWGGLCSALLPFVLNEVAHLVGVGGFKIDSVSTFIGDSIPPPSKVRLQYEGHLSSRVLGVELAPYHHAVVFTIAGKQRSKLLSYATGPSICEGDPDPSKACTYVYQKDRLSGFAVPSSTMILEDSRRNCVAFIAAVMGVCVADVLAHARCALDSWFRLAGLHGAALGAATNRVCRVLETDKQAIGHKMKRGFLLNPKK